jgi:RimJ/RimL family protein N-acetyltransferase
MPLRRPVADPVLRTEHLVLHPLTPSLARAVLDGDSEHASAPGFPRPDDRWVLEGVLASDASASGSWLVARDGALVGSAGAAGGVTPDGDQEIGYGLVPGARGAGTGTEAVAAVAAVLERRPGVRRLTAEVLPGNEASLRLLRRLGFVEVDGGAPPHVRLARAAPGAPAVRGRVTGRHVC